MFVLVNRLTRNRAAGVIAGIIFAFAPYRFEHYMHMELQWTIWMPLALWAVHRTIDSGRWQHGLQAGVFVALQMLSSVYYGIFLATHPAARRRSVAADRAAAAGAASREGAGRWRRGGGDRVQHLRVAVSGGEPAGGTATAGRDQPIQRAAIRLPCCHTGQQNLRRLVREPG